VNEVLLQRQEVGWLKREEKRKKKRSERGDDKEEKEGVFFIIKALHMCASI